jgi:CTP:molybdopterin cytidylyltransferase MocA
MGSQIMTIGGITVAAGSRRWLEGDKHISPLESGKLVLVTNTGKAAICFDKVLVVLSPRPRPWV